MNYHALVYVRTSLQTTKITSFTMLIRGLFNKYVDWLRNALVYIWLSLGSNHTQTFSDEKDASAIQGGLCALSIVLIY